MFQAYLILLPAICQVAPLTNAYNIDQRQYSNRHLNEKTADPKAKNRKIENKKITVVVPDHKYDSQKALRQLKAKNTRKKSKKGKNTTSPTASPTANPTVSPTARPTARPTQQVQPCSLIFLNQYLSKSLTVVFSSMLAPPPPI